MLTDDYSYLKRDVDELKKSAMYVCKKRISTNMLLTSKQ